MESLALDYGNEAPLNPDDPRLLPAIQPAGATPSLGLADSGAMDSMAFGGGAAPAVPSLGLTPQAVPAAAPSSRTQSDQDYLQSLSTSEKLGLALQSFAAGVRGQQSPIDQMIDRKHAQEKSAREDLTNTITTIQKASEILRKLPQDSLQRQAVAEEIGKVIGPKFAPLLNAIGSDHEDALKNYLDIMGDKDVQQMAVKTCASSPDFQACVLKLSTDDSWGKKAEKIVDSKRFGGITAKMRVVSDRMKAEGKDKFTLADLTAVNKDGALFTPEEMNTITRNEDFWGDMGLKSRKTIEGANAAAAKQAERTPGERAPQTVVVGDTRYQFDPENAIEGAKRLKTDSRYAEMGPAKGEKSNDLTEAQMSKIRREKSAYDNALTQMGKFKIGPDGSSSDPNVQARLMPQAPIAAGSNIAGPNPKYDPTFAGRVRAWAKATEGGDPYVREGITTGESAQEPKAIVQPKVGAKAPTVRTKADFDALPPNAEFIDARDGKRKIKGKLPGG